MINLALIEDDAGVRERLETFLQHSDSIFCQYSCDSVESFLEKSLSGIPPQVILKDIGLPGVSGLEGIRLVKERMPETDIIMFTVYDDAERIFKALCAGASGYLLKTTKFTKITEAIHNLHAGWAPMSPQIARKVIDYFNHPVRTPVQSSLTAREQEVVTGLVDGLSYKLIADRLGVTIETVRQHIKKIYRKLQVNSKAEVITRSLRGEI